MLPMLKFLAAKMAALYAHFVKEAERRTYWHTHYFATPDLVRRDWPRPVQPVSCVDKDGKVHWFTPAFPGANYGNSVMAPCVSCNVVPGVSTRDELSPGVAPADPAADGKAPRSPSF
jgi:hypothetical protein